MGGTRSGGAGRALVASVAIGALLVGCAAEDDAPTPVGAVIGVAESELGTFLVDADGLSLYLFTSDSPGVSTCTAECLTAWPAVLTEADPVAEDPAQQGLLGTFTRDDGSVQVTYAGWPLYRYAADAGPGDINGQGVGDVWFIVGPGGSLLRAPGTEVRDDVYGSGSGSSGSSPSGYSSAY